ncbi:hypothetical protein HY489_02620 [Candidatus Woesearchaeota archaeon]|nr:hypothetical protein [Candidatus Woesearchaeota archaeon]
MTKLDIGDMFIDRVKSSLFLYYLARASQRQDNRQLRHRKEELAVKQMRKLNTNALRGHVKELDTHMTEAIKRERAIQTHQQGEEHVHTELKHKITALEGKLGRYLETQEQRKKRVQELEQKIVQKFKTKKEKINALHQDVSKLTKIYLAIKKSRKHTPEQLLRVAKRIAVLKQRIAMLH